MSEDNKMMKEWKYTALGFFFAIICGGALIYGIRFAVMMVARGFEQPLIENGATVKFNLDKLKTLQLPK